MFRHFFLTIMAFNVMTLKAQSDIKISSTNTKINHLDKQNRKQGDWIFFDKLGNVKLTCVFKNDDCISPLVFFENSDTVFIRFPIVNSVEPFVLFANKRKYYGDFINKSDSNSVIEIDSDSTLNEKIIFEIKKYKQIAIDPNYYFAQKRMSDYVSASFTSSEYVFNKPINVLLTINKSGIISKVEFPSDKNNLSGNEERELHWMYSTMPRWQPFFLKNEVQEVKVLITNNSTLSISSFDH